MAACLIVVFNRKLLGASMSACTSGPACDASMRAQVQAQGSLIDN